MTILNGKAFAATNGKPFLANGKKEQTTMSVAIATFVDVVVFLSVSLGFIFKVSIAIYSFYNFNKDKHTFVIATNLAPSYKNYCAL